MENLSYTASDGTALLKHLNIELKKGRRTVLMGANGSGKSLLLQCLSGLERPTEGTIYRNGVPYDYSPKGLQFLQQQTAYFLKLSDGTVRFDGKPALPFLRMPRPCPMVSIALNRFALRFRDVPVCFFWTCRGPLTSETGRESGNALRNSPQREPRFWPSPTTQILPFPGRTM